LAPDIWFPHLGIRLYDVSRIAFSIFGIGIYWYALFIMLGVLAGLITAKIEAKRSGQSQEMYMDLLLVGLPSALIGLRLFFVAMNWEIYSQDPIRIITGIREGGLAIFGGIITSILAVYLFTKIRKLDIWLILDTCAPSFALGQAIGRWGNFVNREAFGNFTDNFLAMRINRTQTGMPLTQDILDNLFTFYPNHPFSPFDGYPTVEFIQVHPTFLYESIGSLIIFALLTAYRPRKNFGGEIFWLYLAGYGLIRFFIESLRTDQLTLGTLPISQALAAVAFIVGIAAIILRRTGVWQTNQP